MMTNAVTGLAAAGATRSFQPQCSAALAHDAARKVGARRALDALEVVEHPSDPQMAAEIVSCHLDRYTRDTTLPLHVVCFLDRRWRSVLTRACVEEGDQGSRWRWALDTTEMLCWSVQPKRDQAAKQRLFALLPELLQRLHAGLETLSMHRVEEDAFFSELSKLHVAALHPQIDADEAATNGRASGELSRPVIAERARGQAQRTATSPPGGSSIPADTPSVPAEADSDLMQGLVPGASVEWLGERATRRVLHLTWVSGQRGVFVFRDHNANGTLSVTAHRLRGYLQQGSARLLGS